MTSGKETMQQFVHRKNIERYQKLLGTYLTADERRFVERRLAEERDGLQPFAANGESRDMLIDAA